MSDELRKAAQDFADSVDGYENDLPLSAIRAKGALRAALAKNANAAPNLGMAHIDRLSQVMLKHGMSTGHGDTIAQVIDELDWQIKELREKNAVPQDSVSVPLDFLGAVCGALNRSGESPKLLEKARNFVQHGMGHPTNAAPQDQDAKNAARYRMARFKGTISDEWQESLDHWIALDAALAAMKEKP